MAICYRKDLFEKAGLPTDRDAVGELWAGDWNKYLDAGKEYKKKAPEGTGFVDSAPRLFNAAVSGSAERYYDKSGKVDLQEQPGREGGLGPAAMASRRARLTAKLQQFTPAWDQGYANGTFATVSCPAWMLGYIQEKAGDEGQGQVGRGRRAQARQLGRLLPRPCPRRARTRRRRSKLAAWLTAPEQQAKLFEKQASFPSAEAAYDLPAGRRTPSTPYFGDAPIGKIFSEAAKGIPAQVLGPKDLIIAAEPGDIGMLQVEQKGKSARGGLGGRGEDDRQRAGPVTRHAD